MFEIPNAICIHEEDYGLLWKHTDQAGRVDRARSRRLVISSIVTVGNYEYGFFWYLYQDATWQFEAKLTGIVHSAGWVSDERSPYSLPLGEGFVTSHHQHFFCARLDLDVDGTANTAFQSEAVCEPWGAGEPRRRRVPARAPTFTRESDGRATSIARDRRGGSGSRTRRAANRIGDPVSYELVPGDSVAPMQQRDSSVRKRARFIDYNLWVTPYRADERYPAGEFPNQHAGEDGLPAWTAADRPLEGERRRALVRVRRASLPAARGLARDAGRLLRLPPAAGRVLRRESGARRAAAGALRALTRRRLYACPAMTAPDPLRVAVVGSGPAGFYAAADLLTQRRRGRHVRAAADAVGPRAPRRGARPPEHQGRLAGVREGRAAPGLPLLRQRRDRPHLSADDLRSHYHAVVWSVGAQADRRMGIPGEDLPGSLAATAFVAWYNGHPDYADLDVDLDVDRIVVVGNGNVAVDCARMLALTREELAPTDTIDDAIEAIVASRVQEIVVLGRRGPLQAAYTTPELLELGELAGADVMVDPADMARRGEVARTTRPTRAAAQRRDRAGVRAAGAHGQAAASCGCASWRRRSSCAATAASRRW